MVHRLLVPIVWGLLGALCATVAIRVRAANSLSPEIKGGGARPMVAHLLLNSRIAEVHFDHVPLAKAVARLAEMANASLAINWTEFESDAARPVTVDLKDVSVGNALNVVFTGVNVPGYAYWEQNGMIVIGEGGADQPVDLETRAYDVRDLMEDYVNYDVAPILNSLQSPEQRAMAQNYRPAINVFVKWLANYAARNQNLYEVSECAGRLLITASPEEHAKISTALAALRTVPKKPGALESALTARPER